MLRKYYISGTASLLDECHSICVNSSKIHSLIMNSKASHFKGWTRAAGWVWLEELLLCHCKNMSLPQYYSIQYSW